MDLLHIIYYVIGFIPNFDPVSLFGVRQRLVPPGSDWCNGEDLLAGKPHDQSDRLGPCKPGNFQCYIIILYVNGTHGKIKIFAVYAKLQQLHIMSLRFAIVHIWAILLVCYYYL